MRRKTGFCGAVVGNREGVSRFQWVFSTQNKPHCAISVYPDPDCQSHLAWRSGVSQSASGLIVAFCGRLLRLPFSQSDAAQYTDEELAQVLAREYHAAGSGFVARMGGQLAVAVWDHRRETLTLISDPLGNVPLYFVRLENGDVHWGTELIDVARGMGQVPQLDADWASACITCVAPEVGSTAVAGIRVVPPGSYVTVDRCGAVSVVRHFRPVPAGRLSVADRVQQYRERLTASIAHQVSQGEIAVAVSGGLDSSSVVRVAERLAPGRIHSVTLRFPTDPEADELHFAQAAVEGTTAGPLLIGSARAAEADLASLLASGAEPDVLVSIPFGLALSDLARQAGCNAVLTGVGGDVIGGFATQWILQWALENRWCSLYQLYKRRSGVMDLGALVAVARVGVPARMPQASKLFRRLRHRRDARLANIDPATAVFGALEGRAVAHEDLWRNPRLPAACPLDEFLAWEANLIIRVLRAAEQLSGVVALAPFLDPELLQLVAGSPWSLRYDHPLSRVLLRDAMQGIVPDPVRLRSGKSLMPKYYQQIERHWLSSEEVRQGGHVLEPLLHRSWDDIWEHAASPMAGDVEINVACSIGLIGAWLRNLRNYC